MMKRLVNRTIILVIALCMMLSTGEVFAMGNKGTSTVQIYQNTMTEVERQEEHLRQMIEHLNSLGISTSGKAISAAEMLRNDPNDYMIEYGTTQIKSVSGYPSGQPSGGMKFPTGGGFYYSTSGGPMFSVSVELPKPYSFISISLEIGSVATSGFFVSVPNTTDYFKLHMTNQYEVKPYIIYKKQWNEHLWKDEWVYHAVGWSNILVSCVASAKKV